MTHQFHELLLSELRMVTYRPGDLAGITDDMLCEAVTVNENLQSLGFILRPDDMIRLAASDSLRDFYKSLKALVPDVKAQPMYPGFPQQVMEISEAEFRMHQLIHYFSTYGVEDLFGGQIGKGWLPEYEVPERTEKDTALLECRVIELIPEQEAPIKVLKTLLGRRERLTNPELDLVRECVPLCTAEQLEGVKVRFKENIELLFPLLMGMEDRKAALRALRAVCAHTGDVLTRAMEYLRQHKYHLSTSDKKMLVKLLEAYPVRNLRTNLMQSLHLRERNLLVLQHLDYNRFSKSPEHREAVRALRNSELLSWHGVGEALLREKSPEALTHFAQRPGYMVRMLNRLLSLDYGQEAILEAMTPHAGAVSGHLAMKTIRTLMKRSAEMDAKYRQAVEACQEKYRREENAVAPNLVYFQNRASAKAAEMRRSAARKWLELPRQEAEEASRRESIALRAAIREKEEELAAKERILKKIESEPNAYRHLLIRRNANSDYDMDMLYIRLYQYVPEKFRAIVETLEAETAKLKAQAEQARTAGEQWLTEELARIDAENIPRYTAESEEIDRWEQAEKEKAQERFRQEYEEYQRRLNSLPERRAAELADLEKKYLSEQKAAKYDAQAVEILKALLKAHFRQADTPLKGKKVYCDLGQFDLAHSTLETEDRSKDGGYIRSGISYRIPDKAKYVRFFVYWNDHSQVDVDLHAGGRTTGGQPLHVGWNADFRQGGVVHSGDITHSDAAEYIDIDLSAPIQEIYANVSLFYGKYSFKGIKTCYVGLMAVDQIGQNVKHYDPANCFFTHTLTQNTNNLFYGYIDVQNRYVRFVGQPNQNGWGDWASKPAIEAAESMFSLKDYLDCVLEGQEVQVVDSREEADAVLTMGKSMADNSVSLADSNFFLEC